MEKIISCTSISVDCVANDPVDINCGGPAYLGFDFSVNKEQVEEMKNYIIETLNSFEVPISAIYSCGEYYLNEEKVWTKERILEAINKDADYLKSEARRNYSRRRHQ
jgi:hypothetical protein